MSHTGRSFHDGRSLSAPRATVVASALLLLLVGGCALRSPRIADLQHNPGRYFDKKVSVEGQVTSAWGLPLVPYGFYRVSDGTGEMTVLSRGRTPARGAKVRVTGRVGEMAVLGGRPLGLHLREEDVDYRK